MVIGIIEDDTLLRKALDTSLKNQGYITILAGSRKEAIKNIDSSEKSNDGSWNSVRKQRKEEVILRSLLPFL